MGGRPAAAARRSVGSTPAMDAKVASQSQGQVRPEERVPRCLVARAPPETQEFLCASITVSRAQGVVGVSSGKG